MDETRVSSSQYSPSGGSSASNRNKPRIRIGDGNDDDWIGSRFRLEPGNPRNPDYSRNPFVQVSDIAIVGAIKDSQKRQRDADQNLFKPSFIHEQKAPAPTERFVPKSFDNTPVYVMAANGIPTTYLKKKPDSNIEPSHPGVVSHNRINTSTASEPSRQDGEQKDARSWKNELPQHIKSLQFMIEVLNDRHAHPEEFASASLHDIPAPIFGSKYSDLECLNNTWADPVFPYPGDRVFAPINRNTVVLSERPNFDAKEQCQKSKNRSRPRSKSGTSDLISYRGRNIKGKSRKGSLGNSESQEHTYMELVGSEDACNRKIDENGALIVEEISDDDEENLTYSDPELANGENILANDVDVDVACPAGREFGNISPISEEMFETENVGLETSCHDLTSPEGAAELSLISRLNCSSPVLSHSPSLRKTPIFSNILQDTPPSSGTRRVRNIARALHDISDREEEERHTSSSSADEKTESFEIDLAAAGDGISGLNLNKSFEEVSVMEPECGQGTCKSESKAGLDELNGKRTVWETLCANIEAHIGDGNPAGFISGPIDHPLQIPDPLEAICPSYMYYDEPLAAIPKLP